MVKHCHSLSLITITLPARVRIFFTNKGTALLFSPRTLKVSSSPAASPPSNSLILLTDLPRMSTKKSVESSARQCGPSPRWVWRQRGSRSDSSIFIRLTTLAS